MNISKLLKKYKHTRSPYIFYDDNMPSMYFTVLEDDQWQLYFTDNKEVQKVDFLQDISIESVTCFKNKVGNYCVSFCGKMGGIISLYYTETKNPTQFKVFTSLASNCRGGVVTPQNVIINDLNNDILIYKNTNAGLTTPKFSTLDPKKKYTFDFINVKNVSFLNSNPKQLFISYQDYQNPRRCGTVMVDLNNIKQQKQIVTDKNQPIFDVTIDPYTNQVLYSKHNGLRYNQRKIAKTYLKNIISNNVQLLK